MTERRDRKDVLLEAGLALASELSLPIVLQRIVDLAAEVTDARYGALGVIAGEELVEFITTGLSAKQRREIGWNKIPVYVCERRGQPAVVAARQSPKMLMSVDPHGLES